MAPRPTLSVAGGTATFGISAPGFLVSAFTKTAAAWAVGSGNGALDTGSISPSTWYHAFLVLHNLAVSSGNMDVLLSLSATSPTLPTDYNVFGRIGSMKTDGSSQWVKFIQDGPKFRLATPVRDVNAIAPGTTAVTRALPSVPLGIRVQADIAVGIISTNGGAGLGAVYVSDLLQADIAASSDTFTHGGYDDNSTTGHTLLFAAPLSVMTNTSQQIRTRCGLSAADTSLLIVTHGWTDRLDR
jgi:hypothetical protein